LFNANKNVDIKFSAQDRNKITHLRSKSKD